MDILLFTSLYPSPNAPTHGIFVQELARGLSPSAGVHAVVPMNGWRGLLESRRHIPDNGQPEPGVSRCRFWTVPRVLKGLDAGLMAYFSRRAFQTALGRGPALVHAHYAYPDAAAAAILARQAGLPLVVTCHGSDINVLAKDPVRGRLIAATLGQAAAVVAVSRDLAGKIAALGVDPRRIHHIPNGVDLSRFAPGDRAQARRSLGLAENGHLLVAAGRLEPVKGYDRLLKALALVPDAHLTLVGDGSQRQALEGLCRALGIEGRVRFAGTVAHERLAPYFQAANLMVMSSHSEGWPTVIHEALACGAPVAAPAVGGIPEALADTALGLVLPSNDPPRVLAEGIRQALATVWDATALRRAASAHSWDAIAARHLALYERVLTNSDTIKGTHA